VQVGERLRILPGDESAVVKCELRSIARSFTLLTSFASDRIRRHGRSVGCRRLERHPEPCKCGRHQPRHRQRAVRSRLAGAACDGVQGSDHRVRHPAAHHRGNVGQSLASQAVFRLSLTPDKVELFHQSQDVPAALSKLVASIDRSNGTVIKEKPRLELCLSSFLSPALTRCQRPYQGHVGRRGDHSACDRHVRPQRESAGTASGGLRCQQGHGPHPRSSGWRDHRRR
jgi:hypothetical protein